jgi:hypothetical protein
MTSFAGKFEYLDQRGTAVHGGVCRLTIEDANLRLIPERGQPLVLDLGDIDIFSPGDYQLLLKLYTGKTIVLNQFGKVFQNLYHDLLDAYRDRLVQCLLLEDLEEIERFDGFIQFDATENSFSSPAQLRLYKSNLAILPETATGLHWRLSDIDTVDFDKATYRLELCSGAERLIITKLAKRTDEFIDRLSLAMNELSDKSAKILQALFPFLSPDQFQQIARLMKEGHATAVSRIAAIHHKIEQVLLEKTVDIRFKPYFDILKKQMGVESDLFTGFKIIRPEGVSHDGGGDEFGGSEKAAAEPISENGEKGLMQEEVLHWFLFPVATLSTANVPTNVIAWESTLHSGRATYFFRTIPKEKTGILLDSGMPGGSVELAIKRLNRALLLFNFRREPIYLPDHLLETQPRYRRYAVACRRIAALRELRMDYIGRAIHTSPEGWQKQADAIFASV